MQIGPRYGKQPKCTLPQCLPGQQSVFHCIRQTFKLTVLALLKALGLFAFSIGLCDRDQILSEAGFVNASHFFLLERFCQLV